MRSWKRLTGYNVARAFALGAACLVFGISSISFGAAVESGRGQAKITRAAEEVRDDAGARAAFRRAYTVFTHPRCMNCHPAGDAPLQGDDSHPHAFLVRRGADGKGLPAMRCGNCHQTANQPGEHAPPGAPDWHLPPPQTPMAFQGKTVSQLCRQLKDPRLTGGRALDEVLEHMSTELVLWAWNPGEGRSTPPLSYEEFVGKLKEWRDKGGACPE